MREYTTEVEKENHLNCNAPEMQTAEDVDLWIKTGFLSQEDYDSYMRRMGDRSK